MKLLRSGSRNGQEEGHTELQSKEQTLEDISGNFIWEGITMNRNRESSRDYFSKHLDNPGAFGTSHSSGSPLYSFS